MCIIMNKIKSVLNRLQGTIPGFLSWGGIIKLSLTGLEKWFTSKVFYCNQHVYSNDLVTYTCCTQEIT